MFNQELLMALFFFFMSGLTAFFVMRLNRGIVKIASDKMEEALMQAEELRKSEKTKELNSILSSIVKKIQDITINLNSLAREIESASEEQASAASQHASGVTEVSATLEELSITARQITANVGELIVASGDALTLLRDGESNLSVTVDQLDEAGKISSDNANKIGELGKRSTIIGEMVTIIKEVANKTNILSINASIEASRAGESGMGFSVVAAEIRELSKETIASAKQVEKAAKEIQDFLGSIVMASESESSRVVTSGRAAKELKGKIENVRATINNNYSFSQKIDVSIKQQENGSKQATQTMNQLAEIARQSAEVARQTLQAVKDIVKLSAELDQTAKMYKMETS
jgi:methyl-accepting chemotaxis protein